MDCCRWCCAHSKSRRQLVSWRWMVSDKVWATTSLPCCSLWALQVPYAKNYDDNIWNIIIHIHIIRQDWQRAKSQITHFTKAIWMSPILVTLAMVDLETSHWSMPVFTNVSCLQPGRAFVEHLKVFFAMRSDAWLAVRRWCCCTSLRTCSPTIRGWLSWSEAELLKAMFNSSGFYARLLRDSTEKHLLQTRATSWSLMMAIYNYFLCFWT